MEEPGATLKRCFLLEGLSQETLERVILPAGRIKTYPKNAAVFLIQDRVGDIRVLLEGKINLSYYTENGGHNLRDTLLPPSIVGLDLICTKTQISPYMAIATEDSRIFSFPAELLLCPGQIPETERLSTVGNLLTMLSQLNMKKEYRIAVLTQSGLRERIMTYLTMQANRRQTNTFTIPFNRDEMAAYLSVNRSALSHELSKLKQEGIIDFHKNRFRLL